MAKRKPIKLRNLIAVAAWRRRSGPHQDKRRKAAEKQARRDIDRALS